MDVLLVYYLQIMYYIKKLICEWNALVLYFIYVEIYSMISLEIDNFNVHILSF